MHVNMDQNFVNNMVNEVKSQGVFDAFRRDSMADVDTKPAYQNLKQRVENSVTKFLSEQKWTSELNKNQMREKLRKHIIDAGFLEVGVQRIVDQVVNPKILTVFQPRIEDIVYKYLGVDKPETKSNTKVNELNVNEGLTVNVDLLPTYLEAVSPDSDKSTGKLLDQYEEKFEEPDEDDESPPFEPLELPSPAKFKEDEMSNSHLSGISGLTSQSGTDCDNKILKNEIISETKQIDKKFISHNTVEFNQESQLSQVSSNSRLSLSSNDGENKSKSNFIQDSSANVDICEEAQMPKFNENSNSYQSPGGESLHFDIYKDKIKFEGTDRNNDEDQECPPEPLEGSNANHSFESPNCQINLSQNVEDISNTTFNTESRNSEIFCDDDSERGELQIIEDPTQDFSREQSRSSNVFQKPGEKNEKNSNCEGSENLGKILKIPTLVELAEVNISKSHIDDSLTSEIKYENTSLTKFETSEKSSFSQKNCEKQRNIKAQSSSRHSSSSNSYKNYRSKERRHEKEKDKNRKSSSSDSKLSSESYQSKNSSSGRNSTHSPTVSANFIKESREAKTDINMNSKTTNIHKCSTSVSKNQKSKSSDKEKDRKKDADRIRNEKSLKSDREKGKELEDHLSERTKFVHPKSFDPNVDDKNGYNNSKSYVEFKEIEVRTNEETKSNSLSNEQIESPNEESDKTEKLTGQIETITKIIKNPSKCDAKFTMSNPIEIENLNMENMEFVIASSVSQFQNKSYGIDKCEANKKFIDSSNYHDFKVIQSSNVDKPDIIMKNSQENHRFETLISPPPKKRKYDIGLTSLLENSNQINQTNIYKPNFNYNDGSSEINLFGFDIQEEKDNYEKVIEGYQEYYIKFYGIKSKIEDEFNINKSVKNYSEKTLYKSFNEIRNTKNKEFCITSINDADSVLSGVNDKMLNKKLSLQTVLTTQRYSCDDLYKPRLKLNQRPRRRGLES